MWGSTPLRTIMLLMAAVSLMGVPYAVLIPVFAGRVLGGGPHMLGLLMTASGVGAFLGAVWLASLRSVETLSDALAAASVGFAAALGAFAFSRTPWHSVLALIVAGFGFMLLFAGSNTIVQTIVDHDKRGRVMSLLMLAILGTAPFGSLAIGALADRIGAPSAVLAQACCCLAVGVLFARRLGAFHGSLRPIYIRLGLVPEAELRLE